MDGITSILRLKNAACDIKTLATQATSVITSVRANSDAMLHFEVRTKEGKEGTCTIWVFHWRQLTLEQLFTMFKELRGLGCSQLPRICFDIPADVHHCEACVDGVLRIELSLNPQLPFPQHQKDVPKVPDQVFEELKATVPQADWERVFNVMAELYTEYGIEVSIQQTPAAPCYTIVADLKQNPSIEVEWLSVIWQKYKYCLDPADISVNLFTHQIWVGVRKSTAPPRGARVVEKIKTRPSRARRSRSRSPEPSSSSSSRSRKRSRSRSRNRSRSRSR